jgi:hypothetical protein
MKFRFLVYALLFGASTVVLADAEHDRIASERQAANASLAEHERVCNGQFSVSGCLEAARKENRATLTRLRHEELQLDDARRHGAADARRKEIAEKAVAAQARASDAAADEPGDPVRDGPHAVPAPAIRSHEPSLPRPQGQPASGVTRAEQEQINTEKFEARAKRAEAHREAVARRNAERDAKGTPPAPLPVPRGAD